MNKENKDATISTLTKEQFASLQNYQREIDILYYGTEKDHIHDEAWNWFALVYIQSAFLKKEDTQTFLDEFDDLTNQLK